MPVNTGNGFVFVNKQSGKVLDIQMESVFAQLWSRGNGANQRFHIRDEGNWEYGLIVDSSKRGLDVTNWGTHAGARVQEWDYSKQPNQKWIFTPA